MHCIVIYKRLRSPRPVIGDCRSHFSVNWLTGRVIAACRASTWTEGGVPASELGGAWTGDATRVVWARCWARHGRDRAQRFTHSFQVTFL